MMGGFPPVSGTKEERKLLSLFKSLETADKQTLLKFAAYLVDTANQTNFNDASANQQAATESVPSDPLPIERPQKESVIKAIKRLNKTYPMIDKSLLLDTISGLMTDHMLKGRDAVSVIDELEVIFKEAYEVHKNICSH